MIEMDLAVHRGDFRLQISCRLEGSRVYGVVGPSGAGKSTLLAAIAGLLPVQEGQIRLGERVLTDTSRGIDLPVHKRRLGVVFQDPRLFPHYSVGGNLFFGRPGKGVSSGRTRRQDIDPEAVIDMLALGPLLKRRPRSLSGGEQRRVAIGRALLSNPRLLLMDEPLSGLDDHRKRQVIPFLRRIRDSLQIPMLYVSHDLGELLQLTDHLLVLDAGQLAGCGRAVDLAHQDRSLQVIHRCGLTNVLQLHRDANGTYRLDARTDSPALWLSTSGSEPHSDSTPHLSISIRPEDIALSLRPVRDISIQNQLPGRVTRLSPSLGGIMVEVDVGIPLLVQITQRAQTQLNIHPRQAVHCLIKSTAITVLGVDKTAQTSPTITEFG